MPHATKSLTVESLPEDKENCPHCVGGSEAYRMLWNSYKFDVDLAREIVSDSRQAVEMEPDDVQYAVDRCHIYPQHLPHVDIQYPGIVAHYWCPQEHGPALHGTVLIDGHHRAARTLQLEVPFYLYVLSEAESRRVTVRAPESQTLS